jgi:hypothetical protein
MNLNPEVHRLIMISKDDTDCDPDSDDSSLSLLDCDGAYGSPERHSLSGSHGQRPWFWVGKISFEVFVFQNIAGTFGALFLDKRYNVRHDV